MPNIMRANTQFSCQRNRTCPSSNLNFYVQNYNFIIAIHLHSKIFKYNLSPRDIVFLPMCKVLNAMKTYTNKNVKINKKNGINANLPQGSTNVGCSMIIET